MKVKIIVVGPKYQMNVGYIARVAKNFGVKRLFFVRPRANINGNKAIMFSKQGVDLLKNAKVYKRFEESMLDCDLVVGTSGIWREREKVSEREYTLKRAIKEIKGNYSKNATVGIVIGRDDKGLNRDEVERCDMMLHIESDRDYSILNISHALAIILYELKQADFSGYERAEPEHASEKEMKILINTFEQMTKGKRIRNRRAVKNVFLKMIRKAELNRNELHAVITALK